MEKYGAQPLDLMQFINTKYHEPFIHERIEFEKELDVKRFEEALDTLIQAFPVLKCRYDEKENVFAEIEGITGKDLLRSADEGGDLLTGSLDMNKRLIMFTVRGNVLYITVSHLVCDGAGFKQLIYLFCDIYNGDFGGESDYLMNREFSQLSEGTGGGTLKMLLSMAGNYKNKPIYEKSGAERSYITEKTLPKEIMAKAHSLAKGRGATLNDVFLTAYARTLSKLCGLKKINIPCTVDLRKYAKEKTGIANLTGTYNLNVKINEGDTFAETLSAVSEKMRKQKNTRNDIAGPALLVSKYEKSSLEDFMKLYGNMDTSAFTDYTNLGVIDDKKLIFKGNAVKKAVGYSVLSKAPSFQVAVSSFKGETTVSALFQSGESEKEKADEIINGVAFEITAFSEQSGDKNKF